MPFLVTQIIFPESSKTNMKHISLKCPLEDSVLYDVVMNNVNLRTLYLSNIFNPFPRDYLRLILKNLVQLRDLRILAIDSYDDNPHTNKNVNISNLVHLRRIELAGLRDCPEVSLQHFSGAYNLHTLDYHITEEVF